jgi:hypothetical protein
MLAAKPLICAFGLLCWSRCFGQSVLSVSSGSAVPGGSVTLSISLNTVYPGNSAGLQWTLNAPSPEVASFTTTAGPAAVAAQKSLYCANQTCLLAGLNSNAFSNGVVASVKLTLSPAATGNLVIQFSGPVEALLDGTGGEITTTSGIVNVVPGVILSPTAVFLGPGRTVQFAATVSSASDAAVTWSLSPPIGSISDGLYAAPLLIPGGRPVTVTVTATSVAAPTESATAEVTLIPFLRDKRIRVE